MRPGTWAAITVGAMLSVCTSMTIAQVEHIDIATGFTQVVTSTDRGVKTIHVSGHVGQGDDLKAHVESAFAGVVRRLGQAGATAEDVVKVRDILAELGAKERAEELIAQYRAEAADALEIPGVNAAGRTAMGDLVGYLLDQ